MQWHMTHVLLSGLCIIVYKFTGTDREYKPQLLQADYVATSSVQADVIQATMRGNTESMALISN